MCGESQCIGLGQGLQLGALEIPVGRFMVPRIRSRGEAALNYGARNAIQAIHVLPVKEYENGRGLRSSPYVTVFG